MSGKLKIDSPETVAEFAALLRDLRSIVGASRAMGRSKSFGMRLVRNSPRLLSLVAQPGDLRRTHGKCKTPEYTAWSAMRSRCNGRSGRDYWRWGGRGVRVCAAWAEFERFLVDMGERPSSKHSIDRKDNDGHYSCGKCEQCVANGWPANCRWATAKEQAENRRGSTWFEFQGRRQTLSEWARELGMDQRLLWWRIRRGGWPAERAFTERTKAA